MATEPVLTPKQVFEETQRLLLAHDIEHYLDFFADDAVIETKFTATGQPNRIEGKENISQILRASNDASPLKRKNFENTIVHQTHNPTIIIAEYDQISESKADGSLHSWSDVLVINVRDSKIQSVRAYSNPIAIARSMNAVDRLIDSLH